MSANNPSLGAEVNDGQGSTSFPPNGADDAPDESKDGQPTAAPASAPHPEPRIETARTWDGVAE